MVGWCKLIMPQCNGTVVWWCGGGGLDGGLDGGLGHRKSLPACLSYKVAKAYAKGPFVMRNQFFL